jgi:predicted SPOUT superfamily RNA methylase MTH1
MTDSVLVPSSLVREATDKREATRKLGYVARAATVFRVNRLVVFPDRGGEGRWGGGFVETVLRYATTPPYLRKEAFGTRDELEYAGVLPPLRVPSWTGSESDDSGSLREGIVTQVGPDGRVRVNCGLQHPISLRTADDRSVAEGERVTIRVSSRRPVRAKLVDAPSPGPRVLRRDLAAALDAEGLRVAASRHGTPLTVDGLADTVERAGDGLTVAFGAPERGLPEMLDVDTPIDPADPPGGFDAWLNTIPNQGSEVVRTEEAMFATLACLNLR